VNPTANLGFQLKRVLSRMSVDDLPAPMRNKFGNSNA
jgi:hypothetical protein